MRRNVRAILGRVARKACVQFGGSRTQRLKKCTQSLTRMHATWQKVAYTGPGTLGQVARKNENERNLWPGCTQCLFATWQRLCAKCIAQHLIPGSVVRRAFSRVPAAPSRVFLTFTFKQMCPTNYKNTIVTRLPLTTPPLTMFGVEIPDTMGLLSLQSVLEGSPIRFFSSQLGLYTSACNSAVRNNLFLSTIIP